MFTLRCLLDDMLKVVKTFCCFITEKNVIKSVYFNAGASERNVFYKDYLNA